MPGFHHLAERAFLGVLRAILSRPPTWWVTSSFTYSGERTAEVVAQAGADQHLLTPGIARALRYRLISGPWSVPRFSQMPGNTQDRRRHEASIFGSLAGHPVHVGGRAAEVGDGAGEARRLVADFLDLVEDRGPERLWMMRPSCSVIEQRCSRRSSRA